MGSSQANVAGDLRFDPGTGAKKKKTFAVRAGKKLREPLNRFFAKRSLVPDCEVLDPAALPWLADLELAYPKIRQELLSVLKADEVPALRDLSPDHGRIARSGKWKSYFFHGYGYDAGSNRVRCPATAAALDNVPGLILAFFSILEPGMHIISHRGLTKALLNVHLPLTVPKSVGCRMRVGSRLVTWTPGQALVFDDTYEHEVWNDTDEVRVVLLLQVKRPVTWAAWIVGSIFLSAAKRTSYVQEARCALEARRGMRAKP